MKLTKQKKTNKHCVYCSVLRAPESWQNCCRYSFIKYLSTVYAVSQLVQNWRFYLRIFGVKEQTVGLVSTSKQPPKKNRQKFTLAAKYKLFGGRERRRMKIIKGRYLLQLTGLDDRGVAVLVIRQAKQDVVSDSPRHDPGSLRREGDAAAVSDFTFWWHQLSQDHHEQWTLEQTETNCDITSFGCIILLNHHDVLSHRKPCSDSAARCLVWPHICKWILQHMQIWLSFYKQSHQTFIFLWPTFPEPVDPATASIFPFSRYRLMFLRTGVT